MCYNDAWHVLGVSRCSVSGFRSWCHSLTHVVSAQVFNQPIGSWSTGNVESMYSMFRDAVSFNQDLYFDTSSVVDMSNMFLGAIRMTGDLSSFDTSNVFSMEGMFRDSIYNGDISMWDVSSLVVATQM